MRDIFDFIILTPTYNRVKELGEMIEQLSSDVLANGYKCLHIIVNDASVQDYNPLLRKHRANHYSIRQVRLQENHGRERFWITYNRLIREAKNFRWKYAIATADDFAVCKDFFNRVVRHFEFLKKQEPAICCMNLYNRHPKNWKTTRWEDGFYICDRRFFEALGWRIERIPSSRFRNGNGCSSGVHQQITHRLLKHKRASIAPAPGVSYAIERQGLCSQMFPPDRFPDRKWPEWDCNFIDG